jgi:hypothetical protein
MNSVKRVQSLTKRFLKENWHKKSQREGQDNQGEDSDETFDKNKDKI